MLILSLQRNVFFWQLHPHNTTHATANLFFFFKSGSICANLSHLFPNCQAQLQAQSSRKKTFSDLVTHNRSPHDPIFFPELWKVNLIFDVDVWTAKVRHTLAQVVNGSNSASFLFLGCVKTQTKVTGFRKLIESFIFKQNECAAQVFVR